MNYMRITLHSSNNIILHHFTCIFYRCLYYSMSCSVFFSKIISSYFLYASKSGIRIRFNAKKRRLLYHKFLTKFFSIVCYQFFSIVSKYMFSVSPKVSFTLSYSEMNSSSNTFQMTYVLSKDPRLENWDWITRAHKNQTQYMLASALNLFLCWTIGRSK